MMERVRNYLIYNEGIRHREYKDHLGVSTIGVGFNLERGDARDKINALGLDYDEVLSGEAELSDEQVYALLDADINDTVQAAKRVVPSFDELAKARAIVVIDLIFNLGEEGFRGFRNCLAAIARADWETAALEIGDSRYARQVPNRANRNIRAMRDGVMPPGF